MKLGISNIAWTAVDADAAYRLLAEKGVHGIEAAPGVLFSDCAYPLKPPAGAIEAAKAQAQAFGHRFVSMQAVHFGLADAALFGDAERRGRFLQALHDAIDLAAALEIGNIVLGSPRNRIRPDEMAPDVAFRSAADVFRGLGDHAARQGVSIALEANPACYGTNFMTHLDDALRLCGLVGHPAIGINFDLGERLINAQAVAIASDLARCSSVLKHVQVSAADLVPPIDALEAVDQLVAALRHTDFDKWVTIEMRRSAGDPVQQVGQVLDVITPLFQDR